MKTLILKYIKSFLAIGTILGIFLSGLAFIGTAKNFTDVLIGLGLITVVLTIIYNN